MLQPDHGLLEWADGYRPGEREHKLLATDAGGRTFARQALSRSVRSR